MDVEGRNLKIHVLLILNFNTTETIYNDVYFWLYVLILDSMCVDWRIRLLWSLSDKYDVYQTS